MAKGRYKYWWYGIVLAMVKRYPELAESDSIKCISFMRSVSKAIEDTKKLEDGQLRLAVIEMVYFNKTHTIDGASLHVGYSRRNVQKWMSEFIYLVAKYEGYY